MHADDQKTLTAGRAMLKSKLGGGRRVRVRERWNVGVIIISKSISIKVIKVTPELAELHAPGGFHRCQPSLIQGLPGHPSRAFCPMCLQSCGWAPAGVRTGGVILRRIEVKVVTRL